MFFLFCKYQYLSKIKDCFKFFAAEDTTETINEADKIKQMLKTGAIGNDPRKIKEMMMKLKESHTEKGDFSWGIFFSKINCLFTYIIFLYSQSQTRAPSNFENMETITCAISTKECNQF